MSLIFHDIRFVNDFGSANPPIQIRHDRVHPINAPVDEVQMGQSPPAPFALSACHPNASVTAIDVFVYNEGTRRISTTVKVHDARSIIGCSSAVPVCLAPGQGDTFRFYLLNGRLMCCGVGVYNVSLVWQPHKTANLSHSVSEHLLYAVLGPPTNPWTTGPSNSQMLPWESVLEYACLWASGELTSDGACNKITNQIYSLGRMQYPSGKLGTHFFLHTNHRDRHSHLAVYNTDTEKMSPATLFCESAIRRLRGVDKGTDRYSCTTMASLVALFSNAIGGDFDIANLETVSGYSFLTNPVIFIGDPPSDLEKESFQNHQVAWNQIGPTAFEGEVWDAFLAFPIRDEGENQSPPSPPNGMPFAGGLKGGTTGYSSLLVAEGLSDLTLTIIDRPRPGPTEPYQISAEERQRLFPKGVRSDQAHLWVPTSDKVAAANVKIAIAAISALGAFVPVSEVNWADATQLYWEGEIAGGLKATLSITVYVCSSFRWAQDLLWQLASRSSLSHSQPLIRKIGDVAFEDSRGNIIFAYGHFVFEITKDAEMDLVPFLSEFMTPLTPSLLS